MASDIENTEWPNDEMSLQRFNPANPFSVPSGYFEELDQRIMSSVYFDGLKDNSSSSGFNVPENYFEASANQIMSRIQVEELAGDKDGFTVGQEYFADLTQQITSRIAVEEALENNKDTFSTPPNYFDDLQQQITSRIAVEDALQNHENTFSVPDNYFADLSQQITGRIAVEKALENHEDAFNVPDDYFTQLNRNILNRTVNHDMVMRKGVVRRLVTSGAFKYASAACVALIIGVGIFLSQDNTTATHAAHSDTYLHKELSKIPADAIESYLENQVDGNDVQHTMTSEDAPIDYNTLDSSLQEGTTQK